MRSTRPLVCVVLFAACLLAAAPATAAVLFGGPPGRGEIPTRFVRFELAAIGPAGCGLPAIRFAKLDCMLGSFRFGASVMDDYSWTDMWYAEMMVPVHVGFTLLSNPKKTFLCYSMVPDLYVEVSGSPFNALWRLQPAVRAALCADVDYYSLGAGAELGFMSIPRRWTPERRVTGPYFGLRLRVLTFGIGF